MTIINSTIGGYVHTTTTGIWPTPISTNIVTTNSSNVADAFKPKKAGKNDSHVIFVLDDSYSMQSCRKKTIEGFNEFLGGQREDAKNTGIKTFVSLYKFDGLNVGQVFSKVDINSVANLTEESYNPHGSTNLLDAAGGVMMKTNEELSESKKKDRPSVILVLLTDGEENASHTFNNEGIKKMVKKCEDANWGFMFLGANVDAFATGGAMGFNMNNTMQFSVGNIRETMAVASARTSRMKSAYSLDMGTQAVYDATAFTDEERAASMEGKNE